MKIFFQLHCSAESTMNSTFMSFRCITATNRNIDRTRFIWKDGYLTLQLLSETTQFF